MFFFFASDQYHQPIKFPHIKNVHEIYSVEFFAMNAKLPIMAMLTSTVFTRAKKKLPPGGFSDTKGFFIT